MPHDLTEVERQGGRVSHPFADLLPAMTEAEYAELAASIRANGLREPITLHRDGRILDGRHRDRACRELGLPVASRTFDGPDSDALAFVLDLNVKRRHLTEGQRAMLAVEIANMRQGERTDLASQEARLISQADAAQRVGVSRSSVQRAAIVRADAIPEIVAAVRQGDMLLSHAAVAARLSLPRQRQIAADMHNGRSMTTLVLAATRRERVEVIERAAQHVPLSALGRTFPVLYADPPWQFDSWSEGGMLKAAEMHFPTMPTAEIAALPVSEIAADGAVLFMWALSMMLPEALSVVAAWGFTFKTFAVWIKPRMVCGHWFRGKHEPLIVATRGSMPPPSELHSSVFEGTASGGHSSKPDSVRDWIAEAYPQAGKIELFARTAAPGWFAWGNQAPSGVDFRFAAD